MAEAAAAAAELLLPDEEQDLRTVLNWVGFSAIQRQRLCDEAFTVLNDFEGMTEKDVRTLEESFGKRTPAATRIIFGQRRTKYLTALVNWVKDFRRIDLEPDIVGLDAAGLRAELKIASRREEVRQAQIEKSDAVMKEASPGMLKTEAKWNEWEPAFENFLSCAFGVDGIPLSYVIRSEDAPDRATMFHDFADKCVACAPLNGPAFDADKRTVHQFMVSFTQGEMSEDWIKPVKSQKDGREDMKRLRDHFSGEGNATRRIAVAERLRDTLFYKNERSMTFEVFCHKVQKMFNIFEQQKEPMSEEAKVRFLLKKIQHPQLEAVVESLKTRMTTDPPGTITVPLCCNHVASAVSELPDYVAKNRNISSINAEGKAMAPASGINLSDGSIWTGFYPNWNSLSKEDKDKVFEERKAKRAKKKSSGSGADANSSKMKTELKQLKSALGKRNRKIAALKKVNFKDDDKDEDDSDDAGNSFGGKKSKKNKKE